MTLGSAWGALASDNYFYRYFIIYLRFWVFLVYVFFMDNLHSHWWLADAIAAFGNVLVHRL